jgi:uncharacterized DUF497 family protein
MRFEWDPKKSDTNAKEHGASFEEARQVFNDPLHLSIMDERFYYFEERWVTLGQTSDRQILVVVNLFFDEDGEEVIRIISAREATKNERKQYEGHD